MNQLVPFHFLLLIGSVIATPARHQVRSIDEKPDDLVSDHFHAENGRQKRGLEFDMDKNPKAACLIVILCPLCAMACLVRMEITAMKEAEEKAEWERQRGK